MHCRFKPPLPRSLRNIVTTCDASLHAAITIYQCQDKYLTADIMPAPRLALFYGGAIAGDVVLQETIADLLQRIRLFSDLAVGERERLGNLLVDRLWLLSHKLERSPFEPLTIGDHFGLNGNFPAALAKWVGQFATDEAKAGALLIALSVQFFTREQFDNLLTGVAERYHRLRETEPRGPFRAHARPLTPHTDLHSRFMRQARIDQSIPDDVNLEKLNHQAAHLLANSSNETEVPTPYYSLADCIRDLLDLDCVIVEDWSLSGTTLAYAAGNFLRICNLIFGDPTVRRMVDANTRVIPRVRAVTLVATDEAKDRFQKVCNDPRCSPFIAANALVVGCHLGASDRLAGDYAPAGLRQVGVFVPSLDWKGCVQAALKDFESKAGDSLIALAKRLGFPDRTNWTDFVSFGFNKGGWLAVSYANCPSNSLPILWHQDGNYRALFPRSESHHSSYKPEVRDWLQQAEENKQRLSPRICEALAEALER